MSVLPTTTAEDSMVPYSREKEKNCRNCDEVINRRSTHLVCQLCRWKFHLRCTTVSEDDYQRITSSDGSLIYKCAWCSETGALIQPMWYVFDTQSYFKWIDKMVKDHKKSIKEEKKVIANTNSKYKASLADLDRKLQVASSAYQKIQQQLKKTNDKMALSQTNYDVQSAKLVALTQELNTVKISAQSAGDRDKLVDSLTSEITALKAKLVKIPELENEIARLKLQSTQKVHDTSFRPPLGKRLRETTPQQAQDPRPKVRRIENDPNTQALTFAEIIRSSPTPIENYASINIIGDDANELAIKLDDKKLCTDNGILSTQKRSDGKFTVKFANSKASEKFKQVITEKYKNNVVINPITPYTPSMKIVCLDDLQSPIADLISDINASNTFKSPITFIREYLIDTPRRTYRNIVLKCETEDLSKYTANGILIGNLRYRCYEIVRTTQCFRCYDFGHISSKCTNKVVCRHCSGHHEINMCDSLDTPPACLNCKIKGNSHNHRVTAENCPVRLDRISGLKAFLFKKNQNQRETIQSITSHNHL